MLVGMTAPPRVIERLKSRIRVEPDGCWIWTGGLNGVGYGRVSWSEGGKMHWALSHRVMYEDAVGPIPEGLHLDHTCHDPNTCQVVKPQVCPHRSCCNPEHLRPVSARENLLRAGGIAADNRAVTHCPQGHEYTPENTRVSKLGQRECKTCKRAHNRAQYWKNVEKRREYNRAWRLRDKENRA